MAEQETNSVNRWLQIGHGLIIIANIVLLAMMWQTRLTRIARLAGDVPFFTSNFVFIAGGTILLAGVASALVFSGQVAKLAKPWRVWAWIIVTLVGVLIASSVIASIRLYILPFLLWFLIINIGLLLISYRASLAKMDMASITKNALAITFGIILMLVLLEILMRVYFSFLGSEAQRVAYIYSTDQILEASNRYEGQPYTNYGLSPNHIEHNSRGYRGEEFEIPKADGIYRIFALGGSTTYGDTLPADQSYPALLQTVLHEDYGYTHIEVVNAGVNAYSSYDSLANLSYHVLDDEPDMIIVYHGINDVIARLVVPENYSGHNAVRGYWNPRFLDRSLSPSVLWRFTSIQLGYTPNPNQFETILGAQGFLPRCQIFEVICSDLNNRPAVEILEDNPPIYFERNLRNMEAIASANGVKTVFSTWLYNTGEVMFSNPMSQEHLQDAVDEQNDLIRELGDEINVPVIDFASTDLLDDSKFWLDGMHMTTLGTRLHAEFYADYLVENGLLPPPPTN